MTDVLPAGWVWKGYERWEHGNRTVAKIAPGLFSATLRGFRGAVVDATNYATPRDAMNAADQLEPHQADPGCCQSRDDCDGPDCQCPCHDQPAHQADPDQLEPDQDQDQDQDPPACDRCRQAGRVGCADCTPDSEP